MMIPQRVTGELRLGPGATVHLDISETSPITYTPLPPPAPGHDRRQRPFLQLVGRFSVTTLKHCIIRATLPQGPDFVAGWNKLPNETLLEILRYVVVADHPLDQKQTSKFFASYVRPLLLYAKHIDNAGSLVPRTEVLAKEIFYGVNTFQLNGKGTTTYRMSRRPRPVIAPFLRKLQLLVSVSSRKWNLCVVPLASRRDWTKIDLELQVLVKEETLDGMYVANPQRTVDENVEKAKKAFRKFLVNVFGSHMATLHLSCSGRIVPRGTLSFGEYDPEGIAAHFQERVIGALRHRVLFKVNA